MLPAGAIEVATRLDDAAGFERYIVDVQDWADSDPVGYLTWLEVMQAEPQLSPNAPAFEILPAIRRGQVGIAVRRQDGELGGAVVVGVEPAVHVVVRT